VNFLGAKDGLVHISEIQNERVQKVSDVLTEGQQVKVKVIGVDDRGKVKLSMRLVDQETGEELPDSRPPREPREGGERSDRGPRRDGDRGPRRDGDRDRGPRRDGGRDGGRDRGPRRESRAEPEGDGSLPAFLTGNDD
jgi:polyribonucleotide nucleotidyltransferase